MIPRIIHYTWFSGEEFPTKIRRCIDSWHEHLPDWELRIWDMTAIERIDSAFLREAIAARKWAYAADYVRLYAVYHHGGVYLDTDAMLLRPLDEFLKQRAFIGKENSIHFTGSSLPSQYLTAHCFGAEPKHPFIKRCLDYFAGRHFVTSNDESLPQPLRFNFVLLPFIQSEIARQMGYDPRPLAQQLQILDDGLAVYPTEYFDVAHDNKYGVVKHLALGSWRADQPQNPTYDLKYKLTWRFLAPFKWVLRKFNYVCYSIE